VECAFKLEAHMMKLTGILVAVLVASQTVSVQVTSQPIRVRLTGVTRYDIPGVITIEKDRASGRPVTFTASMFRFSRADGEPMMSVPRPGQRVTGEARAIEGDLLKFVNDDDQELSLVPIDSIDFVERQRPPKASRETARGIGIATSVGIFGLSYLAAYSCQPDEHAEGFCWRFFQTLMFVGAPVIGVLAGWSLGRGKWERVTMNELRAELAAANRP
jgi:hypothetical protein